MINLVSDSALGYAIVSGIVLLAVVVFTIVQLRKQVKTRQEEEHKKDKDPRH